MAEAEGESLESWLNKATNPLNRQEDWEYIIGFCDQINKELEGPQIAVRLLAHKIQSPQEWEAIQALTVLEACMKNCGQRFHNEVGKFRFLNELIKVVSPKYLGDRVSEKVKSKIIELLYSWTVALPDESKIKDAYYMLKRQGIVLSDPVIPVERTLIPSPPPRPKNPVFDDDEKSKLLAKLLKSKNPDDLQEANKLIKSMVKEDEARIQKVTKRMHTLEEVNNNVKLLNEMLVHYSKEDSSEADKELMKIAVRLLAHKIQSPQEWEAIQALTVLEACMKNCGQRFHNEVGKFRFLNELIKVVSPKYLGDRVSEKVKSKIIELLYSWTVALPDESKIKDAYYMLKRQGIVLSDPVIPVERTLIPSPPPRPKNPVFDDDEKSKLLAKLLKSKNPDDLQEANKLIKSMVKEDEARIQKVTKRMHTLEEVNNNVKLLNEMLVHYSKEDSSEADKELMKELYERCETKRRTLFKLASETEDNDSSLGDILQASDNLSRVINSYKRIIEGQVINGEVDVAVLPSKDGSDSANNINTLIDLTGLDVSSAPPPPMPPTTLTPAPTLMPALVSSEIPILPPPPQTSSHSRSRSSSQTEATSAQPATTANSLSLLDEELLCLGLNDPPPTISKEPAENSQWNMFQNEPVDLDFLNPKPASISCNSAVNPLLPAVSQPMCGTSVPLTSTLTTPQPVPSIPAPASAPFIFSGPPPGPPNAMPVAPGYLGSAMGSNTLHKMDQLGHLLDETKGPSASANIAASVFHVGSASTSAPLTAAPGGPPIPYPSSGPAGSGSPLFQPASFQQQGSPLKGTEISLANVHVPLESIKPSSALPVTAYDKNGLRILLHFAKECPPGRPDVLVVVVSMLNTAPLPLKNIVLQAAVPKSMKVKLQPPSGTELAPFNPIQAPAAITQVMLLANPRKEKVRLRYRLTFALGDQPSTEVGEVDQFPPVEQWGNL